MNFKRILYFVLLMGTIGVAAQEPVAEHVNNVIAKPLNQYPANQLRTDEYGQKYYYDQYQKARIYDINGETVVVMDELYLVSKPKFNNQLDRNYYYFINKKLYRVYPLFLKALDQYKEIEGECRNMESGTRRAYIREKQKILADQYEQQLRDLTTTEGRVFTKLMYRATGKTVYEIIKELRGGWSAFWWNVKGNIADISLKQPYNPAVDRTDAFLESLLLSNWNAGVLPPYEGYEDFRINK